jgi:hypothetical protein
VTIVVVGVGRLDIADIALEAMFAELVESFAVLAKTRKLYVVAFVRPDTEAVVWPETTREFV